MRIMTWCCGLMFSLGVLNAAPLWAQGRTEFAEYIRSSDFRVYLALINHYQKIHPGVFAPLELVRLDRIPEKDFLPQAQHYVSKWRGLEAREATAQLNDLRLRLSREANQTLYGLTQGKSDRVKYQGSHAEVLAAIPVEQRQSLSVIDALYLSSTIGKKIKDDFNLVAKSPRSFVYDLSKRRLVFDGEESSASKDKAFYILQARDDGSAFLNLRGMFKVPRAPVAADVKIPRDKVAGRFFNPKASGSTPFGVYPSASEQWIDENTGQSHFGGDGCAHHRKP